MNKASIIVVVIITTPYRLIMVLAYRSNGFTGQATGKGILSL